LGLPDNNFLTDDDLYSALKGMDGVNKWVFVDSCHSGGFWGDYNPGDEGDLEKLSKIALLANAYEDTLSHYNDRLQYRDYPKGLSLSDYALLDLLKAIKGELKDTPDWMKDWIKENWHGGELTLEKIADWEKEWMDRSPIKDEIVFEQGLGDPAIFTSDMFNPEFFKSDDFVDGLPIAPVPIPSTLLLLGSGLLGLAGWRRVRKG
jgi:hypothetical protein